jgi:succinyl-diaminopimelate desuccinylase
MASDAEYGRSTVAPTRVTAEPKSANITPATLSLVLDWRNIPAESPQEIVAKLSTLMSSSLLADCRGKVEIASKELTSYTGLELSYPDVFPSFTTPADHEWLREARLCLEAALERSVEVDTWRFATDGGHFARAGTTVIGFGPGDDTLVHTVEERISINELVESVAAYMALSLT